MGNSYCCISQEKEEKFILDSEYAINSEELYEQINQKETKNEINIKKDIKKANKSLKTISSITSRNEDYSEFNNPLPEFVIIKRKKKFCDNY
jgi:hypothetical protein